MRPILFKRNFTVGRFRKAALLKRTWRPHRGGGGPHGEETDEGHEDPTGEEPNVANFSADFGTLTKASAGSVEPTNLGGPITSATIDSGDSSGHWQISSSGVISPSATGDTANLSGGPYTLTCSFSNAFGSDTATVTITTIANSYSVTTMTEAKAAAADIGTASSGARTIYCRSGTYAEDSQFLRNRAYTNRVTVTAHSGATPVFSLITVHNSDLVTLDGLTFYSANGQITVVGGSDNTIIQNCEIYGPTIDPTGDYASSAPESLGNGVVTGSSSGYPADLSILNNTFHDLAVGVSVTCDGALRIEGNKIENCYSDGIKVFYRAGLTSVTVSDNTINGLIAASTDSSAPHPDFIQFIGGTGADWSGIEITRNTLIARYSRSGAQGIFLDDHDEGGGTYFYNDPYIAGNLIINVGGSTVGIRVRQARSCERIIGNTVVKQGLLTGTGPGIVIGDDTSTGTHVLRNNAADSFSVAGTPTLVNNHTLGSGGATIAYTTAFSGSTFSPTTVAGARTSFSMKANGPLDADTSGGASVDDAGAVGSGYVTWATSEPGNDGELDTDYEGEAEFEALVGGVFVNSTGTRQAMVGDIFLNEAT